MFLTALAAGLFAASIAVRLEGHLADIPINLPVVESNTPIIVYPETDKFSHCCGGGGG